MPLNGQRARDSGKLIRGLDIGSGNAAGLPPKVGKSGKSIRLYIRRGVTDLNPCKVLTKPAVIIRRIATTGYGTLFGANQSSARQLSGYTPNPTPSFGGNTVAPIMYGIVFNRGLHVLNTLTPAEYIVRTGGTGTGFQVGGDKNLHLYSTDQVGGSWANPGTIRQIANIAEGDVHILLGDDTNANRREFGAGAIGPKLNTPFTKAVSTLPNSVTNSLDSENRSNIEMGIKIDGPGRTPSLDSANSSGNPPGADWCNVNETNAVTGHGYVFNTKRRGGPDVNVCCNLRGTYANGSTNKYLYAFYISNSKYFGGPTLLFNVTNLFYTSACYSSAHNNTTTIFKPSSDGDNWNNGIKDILDGTIGTITTAYNPLNANGIQIMVPNNCKPGEISLMGPLGAFSITDEIPIDIL